MPPKAPKTITPPNRRWCFTLNSYGPGDIEELLCHKVCYMIFGEETNTETPHLQGYVVTTSPQRLSGMKKLHPRAHWETANGTTQDNINYCSKGSQPKAEWIEFKTAGPNYGRDAKVHTKGEPPQSSASSSAGARLTQEESLVLAERFAKEGKFDEIPRTIYFRHHRLLEEIYLKNRPPPETLTTIDNYWIHGVPGGGKTFYARHRWPHAYVKDPTKWWSGYTNQEVVIFEDIEKDMYTNNQVKIWCDIYPFHAEIFKGKDSVLIRPKTMVFTSNWLPDQCFKREAHGTMAWDRRFNYIYHDVVYAPAPALEELE